MVHSLHQAAHLGVSVLGSREDRFALGRRERRVELLGRRFEIGVRRDGEAADDAGQQRAAVAVVRDSGSLAIAADFESGLDLIKLFDLGGGMPTRVSVPDSRLEEVLKKLAETVAQRR